jgi:hypothetical protein
MRHDYRPRAALQYVYDRQHHPSMYTYLYLYIYIYIYIYIYLYLHSSNGNFHPYIHSCIVFVIFIHVHFGDSSMSSPVLNTSHILPCIFNIRCFLKGIDPVNLHFDQCISVSHSHCPHILSISMKSIPNFGPTLSLQ